MKKYLWIAGGAVFLLSFLIRRGRVSRSQGSDESAQQRLTLPRKKLSKRKKNVRPDPKALVEDQRGRRGQRGKFQEIRAVRHRK